MSESSAWTILVADDNLQNLELIEAYLSSLDCEIVTATDGQETLEKVEQTRPDLIILDIMMPRLSGFEVCRQLKSRPETSHIPILMVTSLHENADIERGVDAGTDDFLSKPILKQVLLKRVELLLKVRRLESELDRTLAYLQEFEVSRAQSPEGNPEG